MKHVHARKPHAYFIILSIYITVFYHWSNAFMLNVEIQNCVTFLYCSLLQRDRNFNEISSIK